MIYYTDDGDVIIDIDIDNDGEDYRNARVRREYRDPRDHRDRYRRRSSYGATSGRQVVVRPKGRQNRVARASRVDGGDPGAGPRRRVDVPLNGGDAARAEQLEQGADALP